MLVVPAHAKVNLALEVTGRRPDGWHDIASVVASIDWHDLVGITVLDATSAATPVRIRLTGPFSEGVPADDSNLAHRAASLLLEIAGCPDVGLDVWVDKQVPAAAGLGGGSADAAAVLNAGVEALAACGIGVDLETVRRRAAELGSDVPALLASGTLLAEGRGDRITRLQAPALRLAIAVAGASATAAAYEALTDPERTGDGRAVHLAAILRTCHSIDENHIDQNLLGSALEPPACRAAAGLADALARLRGTTPGRAWHLTGSGGAAFALATTQADCEAMAAAAAAAGFPARACRTLTSRPA